MLDFVKKLLGLNKPEVQEQPAKEPVLDAIDMTTKVDGIGHETVKVEKPAKAAKKAPAKPKTAAAKKPKTPKA
jgi:hypothetical protein